MGERPADRVRMFERAVFRVWPIGGDLQAERGEARSFAGPMAFPVRAMIVVAGASSWRELPSTRSEILPEVLARSIVGQLIAAPRGILSNTTKAAPAVSVAKIVLRRSSSDDDHCAAAAERPVVAALTMWAAVVLPALATGAVIKNTGRTSSSSLSMMEQARAIRIAFPCLSAFTSASQSSER